MSRPFTTLNQETAFEVAASDFADAGAKGDKFKDIEGTARRRLSCETSVATVVSHDPALVLSALMVEHKVTKVFDGTGLITHIRVEMECKWRLPRTR